LHVHRRVLEAGERETGSTVHFVDQGMDTGPIVLQGRVPVLPGATPATLERRVLFLEHRLYPRAVRPVLLQNALPPGAGQEGGEAKAPPVLQGPHHPA
ncbi:phosphoribosylglycinamide formyltransferase, partial [Thermus scotoductus]|uniref:phosphoribosylglycinamide formyltransferase n=1 Tax=Thermus scotoductus TaxID=37636 RepID=UPI0026473F20